MDNNITNLSLGFRKKRFTIDGDENRVLEIDTTDMGTIGRFEKCAPQIDELSKNYATLGETFAEGADAYLTKLGELDQQMRNVIDEIFGTNVCEVCVPSGTVFDPVNGQFKYELVIGALIQLYENEMSAELKKVSDRVKKHTEKYAKTVKPTVKKTK